MVKTRIRNGIEELVPPKGGYLDHDGNPIKCENDWHDNHAPGTSCKECGSLCPSILFEYKWVQ